MIYVNFNLRNPWGSEFKSLKTWVGSTFVENKFWEIQIIKNDNWFRFEFEFSIMQDHAGVNLELGLFGYEIHFTVYDNRHWDYEKKEWKVYD